MVHSYEINGLPVKTGDIICTVDGGKGIVSGEFWWLIGKFIPGDVDHIVIYVGPGGRCIEAGAKMRVIEFEMGSTIWDASKMMEQRMIADRLYGIAYPLEGRDLHDDDKDTIRQSVTEYCRAQLGKPYNVNFLNSSTDDAFYCSQLAYKAYWRHGIDLNKGNGIAGLPGTESIVFPQEIWNSCHHKRPE